MIDQHGIRLCCHLAPYLTGAEATRVEVRHQLALWICVAAKRRIHRHGLSTLIRCRNGCCVNA